ncbi:MAG: hypothetical protein P4M01_15075 [Acidobacteriota bacterium]|nr:hypothetical protein [Acidobacteriota bacterium]
MVGFRLRMQIAAALAAVFLSASLCPAQAKPKPPAKAAPVRWSAANYRGLLLGRARRADVLRALGEPQSANNLKDGEELLYRGRGEHHGDITVKLSRAGVAEEIIEAFPVALSRTAAYRELGKDAVTAHYSFAACAANALYREPRGPLELTFFPRLGIVLWPDQYGYDFAAMRYTARQPGLERAPACVKH